LINAMNRLVSVIVPNFNGEKFIRQTLESIAAQAGVDFEAIVVDDGSTDGSPRIVEDYARQDSRFTLLKLGGNFGAARSRNLAIERSRGRFLAFIDSDDLWRPDKLSTQIDAMLSADAALACTAVDVVDAHGQKVGERRVPKSIDYGTLLRRTPIVTSSVVLDTEKVGRLQMPEIRRRQDLAMWLKVIRKSGPAVGVDRVLGSYRVHDNSLSRNKGVSALYTWKVIREVERLPLYKALYYFSFYAVGGVMGRLRGLN
jgi:teichuronic acid biosynthesis glycosyltransferase TuaG